MNTLKTCPTCKESLTLENFGRNIDTLDGLNSKCKKCYNGYMKEYYKKNHKKHRKLVVTWRINNKDYLKQKLIEKKLIVETLKSPCIVCGEARKNCLDFHHINPENKLFGLSTWRVHSIVEILKEIAKCVILCSNCHRKFHNGKITLPNIKSPLNP